MAKSKLAPASFPAGHVSRAMLSRYSHVRMEAKRHALDEIATRQIEADQKRKAEAERHAPPQHAPLAEFTLCRKPLAGWQADMDSQVQ